MIEYERLLEPDARVARCLAELFNPLLYPGMGMRLTITQEEVGYLARVSRQRANQALRKLEEAGLLGKVASDSRQNQADLKSATAVTQQAQSQRDSVSAVSLDEEAVNLMTYQQAYQANMKVINTANQLFDDMLAAF